MRSVVDVNVLGVGLLTALLALVKASSRLEDFYDTEYEDYYPSLFRRDHREHFVSVDHRHIYCDCRFRDVFIVLKPRNKR